jgi:hypothetical protein
MTEFFRSSTRPTLWLAFLVAGAMLLVLHAALEIGSVSQRFLYDLIGASAIVAVADATGRAVRRGLSFRKPRIGRPAFGQEPG